MPLQKFQRQLVRELKTNRKKAGMLALLAVVAIWFWAPLIFKSSPKPAAMAVAPASPTSTPEAQAATAAQPQTLTNINWQELSREMQDDRQMQPGNLAAVATQRNPFVGSESSAARKRLEEQNQQVETEVADETPEEAGFVLSSTVVGNSRKTALINGRVYEEGSQIEASSGIVFRLTQVEQQRVVLERQGHAYPLEIKRRSLSGRATIRSLGP